jgi:hypothetical protein
MTRYLPVLACAGAAFLGAAQPPSLTYIPIPSGHTGAATAINSAGDVVGTECDPVGPCTVFFWSAKTGFKGIVSAPRHPEPVFFLNDNGDVALVTGNAIQFWSARDGLRPVASAPPGASLAGLNKHGELAGTGTIAGKMTAFVVSRRDELTPLGALFPGGTSQATGINDQGMVVGQATVPCDSQICTIAGVKKSCGGYLCTAGTLLTHTFVWTKQGGIREIDTSEPYRSMHGLDINEHGDVAGISYAANLEQRAFFWNEKGGTTFFTCGGRCPGFARLNDRGRVLGWYIRLGSGTGSFTWTRETGTQTIDAPGATSTQGYSINNRGEIVGLGNPDVVSHNFIWSAETGVVVLDEIRPYAINDKGEIAGSCPGKGPCVLRR